MSTPPTLGDRASQVVTKYWGANLSTAAADLGVLQQSLHGVVTGKARTPRGWFFDAMADGLDISSDWLLRGAGDGPQDRDSAGRPLVSGVPSWRRAVRSLELPDDLAAPVLDLPFGVWRAAEVIYGADVGDEELSKASLSLSLQGWAAQLRIMRERLGPKDIEKRLRRHRLEINLGFAHGALQLIKRGALKPKMLDWLEDVPRKC